MVLTVVVQCSFSKIGENKPDRIFQDRERRLKGHEEHQIPRVEEGKESTHMSEWELSER